MIKSELINKIAEENPHLFHRDVERIVATIFDEITSALVDGNRVELRGFGAFSVKTRPARMGRNPRTGEHTAEARFGRFDRSTQRWVTAVASEQSVTRSKRRK